MTFSDCFKKVFLFLLTAAGVVVLLLYVASPVQLNAGHQKSERVKQSFETLPTPSVINETEVRELSKSRNTNGTKLILYWNSLYSPKEGMDFMFGLGRQPFLNHCPIEYSNCYATNDKSLLNMSDAVIVHLRSKWDKPPIYRPSKQVWVFYLMESPAYSPIKFKTLDRIFNWTMTYRLDSDIVQRYGEIIPRAFNSSVQKSFMNELNLAKNKTKLVAWFVTNCGTNSKREKYAKELEKHVKIDKYGKCGRLKCRGMQTCLKMLGENYKFYLAFENARCIDYVTEKVFGPMMYNVVPIVLGGIDYSKILPPHSYINIEDFASPKHLAEYLKHMNDSEYNSFLSWKMKYEVFMRFPNPMELQHANDHVPVHPTHWCDLCRRLHEQPLEHRDAYTGDQLHDWWVKKCTPAYPFIAE